jgi:hypothetical protein
MGRKRLKHPQSVIHITGVCITDNKWNGSYWENRVGNYAGEIREQLKTQGYELTELPPKNKRRKR